MPANEPVTLLTSLSITNSCEYGVYEGLALTDVEKGHTVVFVFAICNTP